MALLQTVYTSTMVSPSKQFIDLLDSIKQNIICNGRRPKIKHSTPVGGYAEGGHKGVDIQSQLKSLKIIWFLRRYFHAQKSISNAFFLHLRGNAVFSDNFKPSTYLMQKSVLSSYLSTTNRLLGENEQQRIEPLNAFEIVNQVI